MSGPQRHETVVNALIKKIFLGHLRPDAKLPPEKKLSQEMEIDRTSLRLGLKRLESMKVLTIRQGDGIYVRDYLKNAGLDFLSAAFEYSEDERGRIEIDPYLLDEIWEFWIMFFPPVIRLALKRGSTRDLKDLVDIVAGQEEAAAVLDRKRVAELGIELQDRVAGVVNNTLVILLFNSCRPLRRRIMEMLFESMGKEDLLEVINGQKAFLQAAIAGGEDEVEKGLEALTAKYESYRKRTREAMRESLGVLSPKPD